MLILNQPFHPDVVATAQIAKDLADSLVAKGHHVTAIASRSIYGRTGADLPRQEVVDGVEIHRVGVNLFGRRSTIGRLIDFALYYALALWKGLTLRRFDTVVCLTTPPYIVLVGLLLRFIRGGRVVYWLMDIYPDVMVAHDMLKEQSLFHRLLQRIHLAALRRVDVTIALGRCMKERLVRQGAAPDSVEVVPVWPVSDPDEESGDRDSNPYRNEWGVGDRLLVMYSGNFGHAHDVDTFLRAAERVADDDRIRFAFVGGGNRKSDVARFVAEHDLSNCIVADYQPRARLADLLAAADVHLVSMMPRWWGLVVPSKFFGLAGAGRGAIFIGPEESEIARSIEQFSCGAVIPVGDVDRLVETLSDLAGDSARAERWGLAARVMDRDWSSRNACTARIAALIEGGPAASPAPAGVGLSVGR